MKKTLTQISLAVLLAAGTAPFAIAQDLPVPDAALVNQRFDLTTKGDIEDVLWSLWQKNKAFTILPPTGVQSPIPIEVDLRNTNTLEALKAIGLKAGLKADVVLSDKYVRIDYVNGSKQAEKKTDLSEETQMEFRKSHGTVHAALKEWAAKAGYTIVWELKPGTPEPAVNANFGHTGQVRGAMNRVVNALESAGYDADAAAYSDRHIKFVVGLKKPEGARALGATGSAPKQATAAASVSTVVATTAAPPAADDATVTDLKAQAVLARREQLRAQAQAEALARELAQARAAKPGSKSKKEKAEEYLTSETISPTLFDLRYRGDIQGALLALQEIQPQLQILPSSGASNPVVVDLNLTSTRLADALRAIEEQAAKSASLAFSNNKVRVVYKTSNSVGNSAIEEVKRFQSGSAARPILGQDGLLMYPFGESQAEITCAPLRACDIQLQAGESINQVVLGDPVRWISAPINSGEGSQAVPHVVVKPTEKGLVTNLIITTNRRTYVMTLKSSELDYISRAGFYYPREMVQDWANQADTAQRAKDEDNKRKVSDLPVVSVDQINFNYDIKTDDSVQWNPVRVFDDGVRVYIQMPASLKSSEAPAFVILGSDGSSELVNYRVKDLYYIVDKIFTKGALIVGVGSDQKKVEIVRKSENKGFFGNLFGGK